jgi:hypothetical protein
MNRPIKIRTRIARASNARRADLSKYRNDPRVADAWDEGEDGYWVTLKSGWRWSEVHAVHEWNAKDLARAFSEITPCDCADCKIRDDISKGSQPI